MSLPAACYRENLRTLVRYVFRMLTTCPRCRQPDEGVGRAASLDAGQGTDLSCTSQQVTSALSRQGPVRKPDSGPRAAQWRT
eukprot:826625-Pleurochrysis_carterae.AAC.15